MDLSLLHPHFLWLLLALPLVWLGRTRDRRHALLRTVALLFLALALARPVAMVSDDQVVSVIVLDRSSSVDSAKARSTVEAVSARLALDEGEAQTHVIEFSERSFDQTIPDSTALVDESLSVALAAAERAIPDQAAGRVILITDGEAGDDRWRQVIQRLSERGIPLSSVPLAPRPADAYPISLESTGTLRVGHQARMKLLIASHTNQVECVLEGPDGASISASSEFVGTTDGILEAMIEFEPTAAGFLRLRARVTAAGDTVAANNVLERTFPVEPPLRVRYLGERIQGGAESLADLLGQGFQLLGAEAEEPFADCDVVVLDDLPARSLPEAAQADLKRRVLDQGLGLLMAGGSASFGPGGWDQTEVASILPVEFRQKEERRDPSTTLVVIIDTSGSMGGARVQLAKEVARLAIRRLLPHDKVGIVEFYGAKRWAAPIQPASNSIDIQRALNRLDAGGGTVIMPALEEAYYGMLNVQTRYKHVLVLTDGGVESGNFEALARKMAEKGITLSTVLVGPTAHSEFLVNLSQWGKGRFYSVPNRFNLPEILLKRPSSTRLPGYRQGEFQVRTRGGFSWLGGAAFDTAPPLSGLVEARSREGARTLLEDATGRPVLATWNFGLGRVTAFLTEPTGPGTENWRDWDGLGRMLAQVLRRTAGEPREPFRFTVERNDQEVIVTARRSTDLSGLPGLRVLDASPRELPFRERAPGLYQARFPWDPAAELRLLAYRTDGEGAPEQYVKRLVSPPFADRQAELQVSPDRRIDLEALAAATGGIAAPTLDGDMPTGSAGEHSRRLLFLAPWLFLLALLAYLADIIHRRIDKAVEVA